MYPFTLLNNENIANKIRNKIALYLSLKLLHIVDRISLLNFSKKCDTPGSQLCTKMSKI